MKIFDPADNCRFCVKTLRAFIFQVDVHPFSFDNFKDPSVLVFDLTSKQDASKKCHFPEQVGEPLRMELNLNFQ